MLPMASNASNGSTGSHVSSCSSGFVVVVVHVMMVLDLDLNMFREGRGEFVRIVV